MKSTLIMFVTNKGFVKFNLEKGVIQYTLNPKESETFERASQIKFCAKTNQIHDYTIFTLNAESE